MRQRSPMLASTQFCHIGFMTKLPWYLFALGQTFFVIGDVITYNYDRFFGTELPFPSIGDVFYLSVYPCLIVGILLLIRRRNPGGDRESVIDSLIVAIGVSTVSWVFLLSPLAGGESTTAKRNPWPSFPASLMTPVLENTHFTCSASPAPVSVTGLASGVNV